MKQDAMYIHFASDRKNDFDSGGLMCDQTILFELGQCFWKKASLKMKTPNREVSQPTINGPSKAVAYWI